MVQCWYMDDEDTDQRLEHHRTPQQFCSLEELFKKTGVEYFQVRIWQIMQFLNLIDDHNFWFQFPVESYQKDGKLDELKKNRGYTYEDEISISKDTLPDYENKIKSFYTEHLHTDEEIRYVVEGSGYFDVRE